MSDSIPGNIKEVKCSGGTPQTYTCKPYTGNIQTHGGYLSIQPQSTTQFCKEEGYDFPQLTAQYSTSSSCRLWNGTSWYEDVACVAASGLQCCKNPTTTTACFTPPTGYTPSSTPPAIPSTAKYYASSQLADGTVNNGMTTTWPAVGNVLPCASCSTPTAKAGQPNPISLNIPACGGPTTSGAQITKYYAFDIIDTSKLINMAYINVDLKIFFDNVLKHSFQVASTTQSSFGMRIIPDINKPGYGWVGMRKATAYGEGPW